MPSINFTITAEDKNLQKILKDIERGVNGTAQKVEESGMSIESMFDRISKAAAVFGVALGAKELVSEVMRIRGEFQQLEVAFNTILGSEQKAAALMTQLTETAAVTPFGLQEVAGSAKQLLAYGVAAEDVNDRLVMLGDIASGLSIPLSDLAYLYGTTMTQGRMYTQDLNQFMGRGIPIADELAKQFGVTKDKVKELVSSGEIGFEEMHKSLVAMTSEGGKFGGLMEAQSKTIKGQISNIEDAIDVMFNQIGQANEGVINSALSITSVLVENYQKIGAILEPLVVTYGAYKVALMVASAVTKTKALTTGLATTAEKAHLLALLASEKAQKALNLQMLKNPYALAAAAVIALTYGIYKYVTRASAAERATKELNNALDKINEESKKEKEAVDELVSTFGNLDVAEGKRIENFIELKSKYPDILANINTENEFLERKAELLGLIYQRQKENTQDEKKSLLEAYERNLAQARESLRAEKEGKGVGAYSEGYNPVANLKRYEEEVAKYELMIQKLKGEIASVDVEKYLGGIKGMSDADITSAVADIENVLKTLAGATDEAIGSVKSLGGEFSKSQLQTILGALQQQQTNRKESEKGSAANWVAKYKKDYEDAEKALKAFMDNKDQMSLEQFEQGLKKLTEARDEAKKKYESTGKNVKEDKKNADELAKAQRENEQRIDEYKKAIIEAEKEAQFEIRQASINAMKEGTDKELEQINLDYDRKLAENEKRREQFVKDIAEQMALQWEVENPNAAQKGLSFDKSKVTADDLTPEQRQILEFYDLLAQKEKMLAQSDVYEELLNKYKTYNQKRKEVEEQYNKDRAAMKNSDGTLKPGFSEDNIRVLDEQKKMALSEIDLEFAMKEEQFRSWARSIASLSLSELNKMLNNARRQLGNMITSNRLSQEFGTNQQYSEEDIARLRAQIAALEAETKDIQAGDFQNTGSSSGIEGLINSYQQLGKLQNAINDAKKDGTDETKVEVLEQLKLKMTTEAVGASVKMLADGMSKVSAFMKECAELSGDIELGDAADQIGALSQNLSAAGQGAASGGWIGAIVGGATDLITQLTEGLMNIKRIKAQWEDFFDDFNHELKLLKYEINDADYDAIFGTNIIGKLNDSISAAKGAYDDYIAHVEKSAEVTADASGRKLNWGVGLLTADIMNAIGFGKEQNNLYLQQVDALKRGLTELQGMSINTTNYSGFLKLFGKEDKYKSLIDIAPELWDEAGNFNVENAKIFLETNKMITDTQREQIQEVIDIYEQYEDAMANINDYLSGIFQDTASTIADRMIDAFTRTGDAMTDLEDLTSQVASNMAKDLIEALLLDQYLAPAMDRIKGLYDPQSLDYEEDATKRTQAAIQAMQDGMDAASSAIPEVNKLLAALQAAGWDVASATEQTASYGGFETMSEDTGSELNGRFTALQIAGEDIRTQMILAVNALSSLSTVSSEGNSILSDILIQHAITNAYLEDIVKYSKIMSGYGVKLDKIVEQTKNL